MSTDKKFDQLILLLTRKTVEKKLNWVSAEIPLSLRSGTDDYYPIFLKANYKDKVLGIFQRKFKYFYDEHEFYWSDEVVLCVIDGKGGVVWEYSEKSIALNNLFDLAREKASGIDEILDDLLS
ncbi:hypothetical protein [Cobetia amphilecti]|uniref:hypothetical protein n=1 Tax=Cobetia amphilecti TaxID=1055104 RepID=UPI001C0972D9|nr:hypothetical protein [Cobetia amphilecti]MBU3009270.1 hypothetical protein [Cobetia amphilecti]